MADVASAVVGYLCVCLSQLDLDAAEPESAADLLDGSVLACILRVVTGPSGPGASHLAGQPSLAAVEKALTEQVTQDRSCTLDDAARALRPAGSTDEEAALSLAVITIVLAVTCENSAGFIECIHELNDDTAGALQQAVQGGMELLPGIDEQAGESESGKAADGSSGSPAAQGSSAKHYHEEEEEEEDSVDVLRAENKALRRETESLRQQLAHGGTSAAAGSASGRAGASAAGDEEDDDDGSDVHKGMSVHLYKQVAQLEAALELAQTQRDEADADVARLRDDLDISRAAVVDTHRVRKELEEARAESALLSASLAKAEKAKVEAEAGVKAMDKATEAAAARTSAEMQDLRRRLKEAERLHREGKFELAGIQTKASAANEEVSRLRKLLEATKEAMNMAEARAAAAEAAASSSSSAAGAGVVSGIGAGATAGSGGHSVAAETMAAAAAAADGAGAAAALAKLEAEAAVLRAELKRARAAAAGGKEAAEAAAEDEEQLAKLQSQLADAEARAIRAESEAGEARTATDIGTRARLQASEAETRAAKAEVDAMQAQLRSAKEEFEATTAASQEEAETQRQRAESLQTEKLGLERVASEVASMRSRLKEAQAESEAIKHEAARFKRQLQTEVEHNRIEREFVESGMYSMGEQTVLRLVKEQGFGGKTSAGARAGMPATRMSFMRSRQVKASPGSIK